MSERLRSFSERIAAFDAQRDATLISTADFAAACAAARLLPDMAVGDWGFECHLGGERTITDFAVALRHARTSDTLLREYAAQEKLEHLTTPAWASVKDTLRAWSLLQSPLAPCREILLEFDSSTTRATAPSCFVDLAQSARSSTVPTILVAVGAAYASLVGAPMPAQMQALLERLLASLPAGASLAQVGFMLARAAPRIRVCLSTQAPDALLSVIERLGWGGTRSEAERVLALTAVARRQAVWLHLDVGEDLGHRLGLEIYPQPSAADPSGVEALLAIFARERWCSEAQRLALLRWFSADVNSGFAKAFNHFKITCEGPKLSLKAYLLVRAPIPPQPEGLAVGGIWDDRYCIAAAHDADCYRATDLVDASTVELRIAQDSSDAPRITRDFLLRQAARHPDIVPAVRLGFARQLFSASAPSPSTISGSTLSSSSQRPLIDLAAAQVERPSFNTYLASQARAPQGVMTDVRASEILAHARIRVPADPAPELQAALDAFLRYPRPSALALVGHAGSGKSLRLQQVLRALASAGLAVWRTHPVFSWPHLIVPAAWPAPALEAPWQSLLSQRRVDSPAFAWVIDDVHRADAVTVRLLGVLARHPSPVWVVCAGRWPARWVGWLPGELERIECAPEAT